MLNKKVYNNPSICCPFIVSRIDYIEMDNIFMEKKEKQCYSVFFIPLFLSPISVLNFDSYAAEEYGKIRADLELKGTPIGPMDMLIAAHAKSEDLILVTNNTREFERVEDLEVEDWTKE